MTGHDYIEMINHLDLLCSIITKKYPKLNAKGVISGVCRGVIYLNSLSHRPIIIGDVLKLLGSGWDYYGVSSDGYKITTSDIKRDMRSFHLKELIK